MRYTLHQGDNREVLKTFADNSIDSIVTDPPYELGFMGKKWDSSGIAYDATLWAECLRVLKPGGHLIAFGGTRTYHRMTVAIEDVGFEIRDCIQWIYGSGFPKSLDVSRALDKQVKEKGEWIIHPKYANRNGNGVESIFGQVDEQSGTRHLYTPATDLAKQWQGWGTALKPAHEPIVVARKPLQGTVADNVQAWGVGALNIDGCRVAHNETPKMVTRTAKDNFFSGKKSITKPELHIGRWPANIILDEEAAQMLDEQSGWSVSKNTEPKFQNRKRKGFMLSGSLDNKRTANSPDNYNDSGGASRFFYVAKASTKEREAGLEGMVMQNNMRVNAPRENEEAKHATVRANYHPTVKPIELMQYLVRLVTPPNGVVLDPFMGSGSTGCAAMLEKVQFIGIELNQEYVNIAEKRIRHWLAEDFMS